MVCSTRIYLYPQFGSQKSRLVASYRRLASSSPRLAKCSPGYVGGGGSGSAKWLPRSVRIVCHSFAYLSQCSYALFATGQACRMMSKEVSDEADAAWITVKV